MTDPNLPICVVLNKTGAILIRTDNPDYVLQLEGNWYFHPSLIDHNKFHVSDRLYTCPYKGTCNWVDLDQNGSYIPDVAWTYPQTLPEYTHIANWYGFRSSTVHYKTGACD